MDRDQTAARARRIVNLAAWALAALGLAILAQGLLTFYLLFAMTFHARRIDLMRMRALGLTPRGAVAVALGEVSVLALASVIVAFGLNVAGALWLSGLAAGWLAKLATLPPDLFHPPLAALAWGPSQSFCCRWRPRCRCFVGLRVPNQPRPFGTCSVRSGRRALASGVTGQCRALRPAAGHKGGRLAVDVLSREGSRSARSCEVGAGRRARDSAKSPGVDGPSLALAANPSGRRRPLPGRSSK